MSWSSIIESMLSGDGQWDALDQSRFNGIALAVIALLVAFGFWSVRQMLRHWFASLNDRIDKGLSVAQEAVDEVKELRLSEREHHVRIENLEEDVRSITGSQHRKRKPRP